MLWRYDEMSHNTYCLTIVAPTLPAEVIIEQKTETDSRWKRGFFNQVATGGARHSTTYAIPSTSACMGRYILRYIDLNV